MAKKIEKPVKPAKPEEPLQKAPLPEFRQWLQNKAESARITAKPRAARAAKRYGAPAGVALIALLTFLSLSSPKSKFDRAKERLIQNPQDLEARLLLIEEYLQNNQLEEAEKELLLVEQIEVDDVLGVRTAELWQKKKELNPVEIESLINAWEGVIKEKPDYRDGFFQLALLSYKVGREDEAREYLQEVIEIDPNFSPAKKLIEELEGSQ